MTKQERQIHAAIYKLITPERPAIVVPVKAEDGDRAHLEKLIAEAKKNTRVELDKLVRRKQFTRTESNEIFDAINAMSKIVTRENCLVGVFAEVKDSELYLHSIAVPDGEYDAGDTDGEV
jgi:hypothetical protein